MSCWRAVAVLTSAALALPLAVASPAAGSPSRAVGIRPPTVAGRAVSATAAPAVPCPVAKPPSPVVRPAWATPPARDTSRPTVGGDALASTGLVTPAGAHRVPTGISATSWVVADLDSGAVLGACGAHEASPPASVQKLLLAATLLGKLDPAQVITVNRDDLNIEAGSSAVGLLLGGKYTIKTLWLGLFLNSGNDAANTLARLGGGAGGVPGALQAMNAMARHLGAYETHAVTPSGLDGQGQFTSAYDLALIARADFARADFREYDATLRAQMPPQPPKDLHGFQIQNDNQLLYNYPGALGGKTGFTDFARHTFVGFAERNGRRLVVTLLNGEARPLRGWQQGAALLDWGFALPNGASVGRLVNAGETEATPNPLSGAGAKSNQAASVRRLSSIWSLGPTWRTALTGVAILAMLVVLMAVVISRRRRTRRPPRRHARAPVFNRVDPRR